MSSRTSNSFVLPIGATPKKIDTEQTVSKSSQKQDLSLYVIGKSFYREWPLVSELNMRELSGILVYQYNQMKSSVDKKSGKKTWFARLFQGLSEKSGYHNFIKQLTSLYVSQPSIEMWKTMFNPINTKLRIPFSDTGIITVDGFLNALYYALVVLMDFEHLKDFTVFSRNEEVVENSESEPITTYNFLLNDQMEIVCKAATEGKSYIYTQRGNRSMTDAEVDTFIGNSIVKISEENDFKELNVIEKQSTEVPEKQVDHFEHSTPVQQNKSYSELFTNQDFDSEIPDSQTPVEIITKENVIIQKSTHEIPEYGVLNGSLRRLMSINTQVPGHVLVVHGTTVCKAYKVRSQSFEITESEFDPVTNTFMAIIPVSEFTLGGTRTELLDGVKYAFLPFVTEIK